MQKRIAAFIIIIAITALSVGVLAYKSTPKPVGDVFNRAAKVADSARKLFSGQDTDTVIERHFTNKELSEAEYANFYSYLYFKSYYQPTDVEIKTFEDLMAKGYHAQDVLTAYKFYLTCDQGPDLIKRLCALKEKYPCRTWVNEAFDHLTKGKHGILNQEDIRSYQEQGLTLEDISTADVLCRKGVYTIHQLLEQRLTGAAWSEINQDVLSKCKRKPAKIIKNNSKTRKVSGSVLLAAQELASFTSENAEALATDIEMFRDASEQYTHRLSSTINQEIYERGYYLTEAANEEVVE